MKTLEKQPERQEANTLWTQLEAVCAEAMRLSRHVGSRLQQGAGSHELVPLLRREAKLADQLHKGIRQFNQRPDSKAMIADENLILQMKNLLAMEQKNYRLLSRKGVRLNAPRYKR